MGVGLVWSEACQAWAVRAEASTRVGVAERSDLEIEDGMYGDTLHRLRHDTFVRQPQHPRRLRVALVLVNNHRDRLSE